MLKARGRPESLLGRLAGPLRPAWLLAGAVLLLATHPYASTGVTPTIRLSGVTTRTEGVVTTVVIETTEPVGYVTAQPDPLSLVVDLRNVTPGQIRPSSASGAVASVGVESASADDGTPVARVRLLLSAPRKPLVRSKWNTVIVEFGGKPGAMAPSAAAPKPAEARPSAADAPAPVIVKDALPATALLPVRPAEPKQAEPKPAPAAAQAGAKGDKGEKGDKQYSGHLVTFDFQAVDLRSVLRTFSDISGLNVVIDPAVPTATVDVSLREVPWDQALDVILRSNHLGYVVEDSVVRIARLEDLAKEEDERRKLTEAQAKGTQLKVLTMALSYAKATDMAKLLKEARVVSERGNPVVDERTNTIIITDLPESLLQAEALLKDLDRPQPQVEVEARIVQTSRDNARALGVQWGINGRMTSELGNTSPLAFPAQGSVSGRMAGDPQGNSADAVRKLVPTGVSLPAGNATSALGISMGTLNGAFGLDVALSAMEKKGQGKILSTPRVMMQNNVEAEMTQGVQIPIQTVSNNTVTVTFKDATLTLLVKPQITAANTVIMDITLLNASPDYSRQVNGIPPIDTQRAKTQVLVNDTETMVIGGIMKSTTTSSKEGVPGLSQIPLLGWLFRRDTNSEDERELLIFITPRIKRGA